MMNDIDPASSALAAFSDLGKRVLSYFACVVWGGLLGACSLFVGNIFSGDSGGNSLSLDGLDLGSVLTMPPVDFFVVGIIALISLLWGLITILKGTLKTIPYLGAILGAALGLILFSSLGTDLPHLMTWVMLLLLIGFTYGCVNHWKTMENQRWENELNVIYEENRRIREAKQEMEKAVIEEKQSEVLTFEEPPRGESPASPPELKPEEE